MADNYTPLSGSIVFTERRQPPLQAGDYEITVTQSLRNSAATDPKAPHYVNEDHSDTRRFTVRGERFTLDPTELLAVFPPNNNRGEYADVLPHAVFNRRTLPWERSPELSADGASWLAILLFVDDEAPALQTAQVGDLQRADFYRSSDQGKGTSKSTLGANTACYGDGFPVVPMPEDKPPAQFELEQGEQLYDPCQVIDVPCGLFARIAPSLADLAWLAHVRTVSSDKKAGGEADTTQDNSVVVGNRMPKPNSKCVAHLVSLEGLVKFLPAADGTPAAIKAGNVKADYIRLISLANWSFTSVDPKETFTAYLENLDVGPLQRPDFANATSADEKAVANAFRLGYTALPQQTRLGDRTVSWMRGPLLPFESTAATIVRPPQPDGTGVISAADQAMRFNPLTGMADVSYAAAWQLGRLLGLQSSVFSVGLYNWKRAANQKTAQVVDHRDLATQFATLLSLGAPQVSLLGAPKPPMANATLASALVSLLQKGLISGQTNVTQAAAPAPAPPLRPNPMLAPRQTRYAAIQTMLTQTATLKDIHADTAVPSAVTTWLQNLVKLVGLPFGYLVPDESMLPKESMRVFHLDPNWVNALIEGACSIGRSSSADLHLDAALVEKLYEAASPPAVVTGFLLRSAVVDGWPGLEVTAYDANNQQLTSVVRMEQLAPSLLLYMVEGAMATVDIHEPAEGLHFGVDLDNHRKELRYITVPNNAPQGAASGTLITNAYAEMAYRDPNADAKVVRLDRVASSVRQKLIDAHANEQNGTARQFTAAEFAVELVEGVQSVRFKKG